jgi:hypothetical protein
MAEETKWRPTNPNFSKNRTLFGKKQLDLEEDIEQTK